MKLNRVILIGILLVLSACNSPIEPQQTGVADGAMKGDEQGHTAPTKATVKANRQVLKLRPFENKKDFDDAMRGFIAKDESLRILSSNGGEIWNMTAYDFVNYEGAHGNAPSSVNPSLWRQATLNNIHGLFKVVDGVYQIRAYDLANMSIIESDNGWILVDPLTSKETASRALEFAQQHLGKQPIVAIVFTHSHIDHFGGVHGIIENLSQQEISKLRVIAPEGFMEEALSENIIVGTAMGRRSDYMFGKQLARSERGHVGSGLGKSPAFGTFGIIEPTDLVKQTGQKLLIDGIDFEFQIVSGSEAPAELTFYLPKYQAFCGAELVSRTMHNIYTLRGAKVRDAKRWSEYIDEAKNLFGQANVYFGSHHWPLWGQEDIQTFLSLQRDTYKYIHDQSVRMLNAGFTPLEIAEEIQLPPSLQAEFHNQGYYGTLKHNAKAIYQHYIGWFDGNPASLNPLPESEASKRYIEMMGGIEKVLAQAEQMFLEADKLTVKEAKKSYRWLSELLNHAVYSEPENTSAQNLLASVYDQLAYQSESAPWRDIYLSGAFELRHGAPKQGINLKTMKEVFLQTPVHYFFDAMSVRLDGNKAIDESLSLKIRFTDLNESYLLQIENAVLHHQKVAPDHPADATLNITHALFIDMLIGQAGLKETLFGDDLSVDGSILDTIQFFSMLDKPDGAFNIVTP